MSHSSPKTVLIIRHGEETDDPHDPHLSGTGRLRAARLAQRLPKTPGMVPDFLFAARSSSKSRRPVETLTPLSLVLHLEINDKFDDSDSKALAKALLSRDRYDGRIVLICWRHDGIPKLAPALGARRVPDWKNKVFDRIWKLDFKRSGVSLTDLPEGLLPGDSA
jgi:hypothetical protein